MKGVSLYCDYRKEDVMELGSVQGVDLDKEDVGDLLKRIKVFQNQLNSDDFSEYSKEDVSKCMFAAILLLWQEIRKLQHTP